MTGGGSGSNGRRRAAGRAGREATLLRVREARVLSDRVGFGANLFWFRGKQLTTPERRGPAHEYDNSVLPAYFSPLALLC